ncbi:MAG: DUF4202 domain-containing protein [Bacteroidota bacterium]
MRGTQAERLQKTLKAFDEANRRDPKQIIFQGIAWPAELLYGRRMTACLKRYFPKASESLVLATRAQHICRWEIPRDAYPMNRKGYFTWRNKLKAFHAEKAGAIMTQMGYESASIQRVQFLLAKKQLRKDTETQTLEDVACLVFLEYYFEAFSQKYNEEKLIDILQKTWRKMSKRGQEIALSLSLPTQQAQLVKLALSA